MCGKCVCPMCRCVCVVVLVVGVGGRRCGSHVALDIYLSPAIH